MHPPLSTLAAKALALLRYSDHIGASRDRLLAMAALDPTSLEGAGSRVPSHAIAALWSSLVRWTGDADLGLKLAESENGAPTAFGLVGFSAMTSGTVGAALSCFGRYIRLVSEDANARIVDGGHETAFELSLPAADASTRWMADRAIASCVLMSRQWTGERIRPRRIRFRHRKPVDSSTYERLFDCAIDFGHVTNAVVFDKDTCRIPIRAEPGDVGEYLETLARLACDKLSLDDAGDAVMRVLRDELHRGHPDLSVVARRLAVSTRTLQRRLLEQGVTYHGLVDRVRCEIAVPLVTATALPISLVRARVGYADDKSFRRAFRRWTGSSPADLRRAR
jgi:AraC-like DNA-binding protein